MSGGTQSRDYRKLGAGIAFSAILLAGLAAGSRWHRAAKAAGSSPLGTTLASSARAAHPSFQLAPRPLAIAPGSKLKPAPNVAAGLSRHPAAAAPRPAGVAASPANQLVANYGKLPLGFEANQGQTDGRVKFLSRGRGYSLFLTGDEAVLTLESASQKAKGEGGNWKPETGNWKAETGNSQLAPRGSSLPPAARGDLPITAKLSDKDPLTPAPLPQGGEGRVSLNLRPRPLGGEGGPHPAFSSAGAGQVRGSIRRPILQSSVGTPDSGRETPDAVLRMRLVGANTAAAVTGAEELPGKSNYFIGNDPKKWHTNVPNYAKVRYQSVYPGVDLVYYGNQGGQLEYDFVVAPGADPSAIVLDIGAVREPPTVAAVSDRRSAVGTPPLQKRAHRDVPLQLTPDGDLVVKTDGGEVRFHKPIVYQDVESETRIPDSGARDEIRNLKFENRQSSIDNRQFLDGHYTLDAQNHVQFQVAPYDHSKLLFIDPVLSYSTYLGGSNIDYGYGIAVDSSGNAYVTGQTYSTDFPTMNPLPEATCAGSCSNAFVAKLNAAGSALVYSTYLGGSNYDYGYGIAVDSSGNAYVTGDTGSTDFPTVNPIQATNKKEIDGANGFVTELNAAGTALVYSTYLGGSTDDYGQGIAVDSSGNAYVTGITQSTDFPTVNPLQGTCGGGCSGNAFVAKLNFNASSTPHLTLVYSTYLGGSNYDIANGIAIDSSGNAYVTGVTNSTDFPTVNPLQATNYGSDDGFVAELNPAGSALVYSTYLGGSGGDTSQGIAVDSCGNAYVTGYTQSTNFPTVNPLQATNHGSSDAFVAKISSGMVPCVSFSPTNLTFGSQNVGSPSAPQTVTVTNTGTANLTISSALIGGTNSGDFATSADTCTGAPLTPTPGSTSTCTINVTFTPTATGSRSASLNFTDNAANSQQSVSLTGTGAAPVAGVSPPSLTFGNQNLGTTSASQPVTLSNTTGTAALTIASIGISANFGESDNCGGSVLAGGSCTINVTFSPSLTAPAGMLTGALTITDNNNGVAGSTQTVSLSGTATSSGGGGPPPTNVTDSETITVTDTPLVVAMPALLNIAAPVADYSVGSLGFAGQTATLPLTVSNLGQANLSLVAVTPPGSPFSISQIACTNGATSLPTTLSSAGACVLSISYVAPTSGTPTGTITFTDNAALSNLTSTAAGSNFTQSIPLSGAETSTLPPSPPPTTVSAPVNETITVTDTPLVVAMPALLTIAEPVAYYSVGSLGFGGQSGTLPLTVSNIGEANLSLNPVTSPASPFSIASVACTNGATSLPTTLPSAGACIFSISYVAPSSGTPTGTITFTDNAALSNLTSTAAGSNFTQTIPLSGAGTSTAPPAPPSTTVSVSVNETIKVTDTETIFVVGPVVSLAPSSLTFPAQVLGTSSTAQTVTLTNTGNASLAISSITASGDFSQTNTCGTSVSAGANCTISLTFKPIAGGTRTGSLSIFDNVPGSPQSVALTGTGLDFTFTLLSGSSLSATVAPGQPAIYSFSVRSLGGLAGTINFSCTGAPAETNCTVSPNPLMAGSSATTVTVTVLTTAPSASAPRSRPLPPVLPLSPGLRGLLLLALALAAMSWAIGRRKQPGVSRWQSAMVLLAAGLLLTLALAGCRAPTINPGTPAGTYTLTVTGTTGSGASALSHSVSLTLIVS